MTLMTPETQTTTMVNPDEPGWVTTVRETAKLAGYICDTDFVPRAFRGNAAAVTAAMLYGDELGIGRMTALQTIQPIQGKVGMSAELMRSLVLAAGHHIELVKLTTDRCTIRGRRAGDEQWQEVTWTLEDAKRAELHGDGWRKYPRSMLMARATTELCRFAFADVLHGVVATEEYTDAPERDSRADALPSTPTPPSDPQNGAQRRMVQRRGAAADASPDARPPQQSLDPPAPADRPEASHPTSPTPMPSDAPPKSAGAGGTTTSPKTGPPDGPGSTTPPPAPDADNGLTAYPEPDQAPPSGGPPDQPALDAPTEDPQPEARLINKYARKEYHALMRKLGVDDRDERMFITRTLANRDDLDSSASLTEDEGRAVIETLRRCGSRKQLEELVAAAHDATL